MFGLIKKWLSKKPVEQSPVIPTKFSELSTNAKADYNRMMLKLDDIKKNEDELITRRALRAQLQPKIPNHIREILELIQLKDRQEATDIKALLEYRLQIELQALMVTLETFAPAHFKKE